MHANIDELKIHRKAITYPKAFTQTIHSFRLDEH